MKNFFVLIFIIGLLAINNFSQSDINSAPVKWEDYKISKENLKIMFPKFPVKLEYENACFQTLIRTYYAYADEVVYKFTIYSKNKNSPPGFCTEKAKFDQNSFTNYLTKLQTNKDFESMNYVEQNGQKFVRIENKSESFKQIVFLLNDFKNYRFFEFAVSTYKDKKIEENQIIDSVNFGENLTGIEINEGSNIILGDDLPKQEISDVQIDDKSKFPFTVLVKPKPHYTPKARRKNTTGEVRLRVTFLPNGAIGEVEPITNLENGLTEKAIEAAKKIVFLPQKYGDKKVAVTKVVVYSFMIY